MGSTQQFCLKWNNHQSNMLSIFDQLLTSEHFVDVTLACDGLSVRAHKMVLSACSPFFQALFIQNPCKHPIVILKDIRFVDLKALVQFMYRGEVNVSQDQLPTLLKAAEALKIKGLAEVTNESGQKPSGALSHNGHHSGLVPKGEQPSVQAAPSPLTTPIPTSTPMTSAAQHALVAAMQQSNLKAQLAVHAAAQAAQNAHHDNRHTSAASHESNSNASTPMRSTDSPMSQQNRKRRRKSAGSEKGSGDENSGAESGADDNLEESRAAATDEESAGEENEFEPSKLLEQTMTEVVKQGHQDNNSSSSDNHTKDSSQADMKPVINFDSNAAGALATLNPQDPTAVLAFAAAAQAAGASANSGDSVAGPSQPTHDVNANYLWPAALAAFQNASGQRSESPEPANNFSPTANPTPIPPQGRRRMTQQNPNSPNKRRGRYQCGYCNFLGVTPSHMKRHILIHTGERPFECPLCPRRFTQKVHLKYHMNKTHKLPGIPGDNNSSPLPVGQGSPGSGEEGVTPVSGISAHEDDVTEIDDGPEPVNPSSLLQTEMTA